MVEVFSYDSSSGTGRARNQVDKTFELVIVNAMLLCQATILVEVLANSLQTILQAPRRRVSPLLLVNLQCPAEPQR